MASLREMAEQCANQYFTTSIVDVRGMTDAIETALRQAVTEALAEPSEKMVSAGYDGSGYDATDPSHPSPERIWTAMAAVRLSAQLCVATMPDQGR